MTRKGKQPGGHNPLTYNERRNLTVDHGTQKLRLGSISKQKFGDCCLSLSPAMNPVVSPSGHIYSREAIVSYLLTKTRDLKQERIDYESRLRREEDVSKERERLDREGRLKEFSEKDTGASQLTLYDHSSDQRSSLKRKIHTSVTDAGADADAGTAENDLKCTSYWLSECQPSVQDYENENLGPSPLPPPPAERPSSPMTGQPLRLKDLIPITLPREQSNNSAADSSNDKCICAVSGKAITTQPVVVIKKTGVVILKDVYTSIILANHHQDATTITNNNHNYDTQLNKKTSSSSLTCPVTGRKFKKDKDVMLLQKGTSGFAASGEVFAKRYRPTLT